MFRQLSRKASQFCRHTEGAAAIEMAFIFPVMVGLYFGMVDVTNALSANRKVTIAASTIADLVTQAPGQISKADLNGFYKAVEPIVMDQFPAGDVGIEVLDYRKQTNGSITKQWDDNNGKTCGAAPTASEIAGFDKLMTDGNDIIIARVCVTIKPVTGEIAGYGSITLSEQFALRPRQSLTINKV
jgi:Flp pilus assembly protein TadG